MRKQIKAFFQQYIDMADAVNYLTHHMSYYFINVCDKEYTMFGKAQLRFLVSAKVDKLSDKQIDKVIKIALQNVIANNKANYMVTHNAIYLSAV